MRRIHRVIDDGRQFYEDMIARNDGARLVRERASFADGRLLLDGRDAGLEGVPTVLAVGSMPARVPVPGAAEVPYLNSDRRPDRGRVRPGDEPARRARHDADAR
jgi:pyruvate/2-oxoglutarate dehydrogenase complex dihydrolipoamide dehydrogenase (E3) component